MAADTRFTWPVRLEIAAVDRSSHARTGRISTPHGCFDTPAFMPVGTYGAVKGILPGYLAGAGTQIVLANTYHLMLRPGHDVVAALGGLHRFMGWAGPILTDSGGFQVYSLGHMNRIDDDGVTFRSHIDGATVHLTPEKSIEVQNALGADIIMVLDECPPGDADIEQHRRAVRRTIDWARRCLEAHRRPESQTLFGIVQGGTDPALRGQCAAALLEMGFGGYAIGGLAVGEGCEAMLRTLEFTARLLPPDRPRYLMGAGYPRDIVAAVAAGVDMFDCVLPTRNGRNACAFTAGGMVRLRNSCHVRDGSPVEEGCDCPACRHFCRGAIRHFFFAGEMLGPILLSMHNIRFYQRLMADIRRAIRDGVFEEFRRCDPRCAMGPPGEQCT